MSSERHHGVSVDSDSHDISSPNSTTGIEKSQHRIEPKTILRSLKISGDAQGMSLGCVGIFIRSVLILAVCSANESMTSTEYNEVSTS